MNFQSPVKIRLPVGVRVFRGRPTAQKLDHINYQRKSQILITKNTTNPHLKNEFKKYNLIIFQSVGGGREKKNLQFICTH